MAANTDVTIVIVTIIPNCLKKNAGETLNKCKWEEYCHNCKSSYNNCKPDFVGGINRSLPRSASPFDMLGYILKYHNCIIHHHPDSY